MSLLRQTLKHVMTQVIPRHLFLVRGPARTAGTDPTLNSVTRIRQVALTFDDGPHPEYTPRLLDYLAASEIRATFFVVGDCAQKRPDLIRRIVDAGHSLGNHTFTHGKPQRTSTNVFLDEVRRTRALLQDLTGDDCCLMRPPMGSLTVGKLLGLWREQQTVVLWNVEPRDHSVRSYREIRRWCESYKPKAGDIILLHDNHPYAGAAVEFMFSRQECEQIQFVSIVDWLDDKNRDLQKAERQVTHSLVG